jgi:hypothetical protein
VAAPAGGLSALRRRPFLRWGLGVGAALAAAGTGGWLALFGIAPDAGRLAVLSDREHRTLASLVPTILGAARRPLAGAVAAAFDGFLADSPPDLRSDLRSALLWLELGPLLYDGRRTIFSDLTQAERETHFRGWMESDDLTRRMVATGLRKFVNLVAYDDPSVWQEIHYPGPATGPRET